MTTLPLKYRPNYFKEVYGNEDAINISQSMVQRELNDIPRSWLFTGPSGTGKTTLARIIRYELDCADTDFHEYNTSNTRGIDDIRDITSKARLAPMDGKIQVYLLDECHQLTKDAQNALLKGLEDTPKHTFFMLCTTNPEKLLDAIKTRCTTISLSGLNFKELKGLVSDIAAEENKPIDAKLAASIAKAALESPREALKILDQVIDLEPDAALTAIKAGLSGESETIDFCRALIHSPSWKTIAPVIENLTMPPENARRIVVSYFTKVLLSAGKDAHLACLVLEQFTKPFFEFSDAEFAMATYSAIYEWGRSEDRPF